MTTTTFRTALVLLAALAGGGCASQEISATDGGNDAASSGNDAAANNCARSCAPSCGTGESCIGTDPSDEYGAICRKTCTSTDDCSPGEHCVSVANLATDPHTAHFKTDGPVCVSDLAPQRCQATIGGYHCDPQQGYCSDPNVAVNPFASPSFTCGVEHTHCPNGCEVVAPDGGGFGAVARCK